MEHFNTPHLPRRAWNRAWLCLLAVLCAGFLLGWQFLWNGALLAAAGSFEWTPLALYGGAIQSVAFSPGFASDKTVFAAAANDGTEGHGVFKSTDGGVSWKPANNGLDKDALYVTSLAISPGYANDHTLFASTHAGIMRSTDAGTSWQAIAPTISAEALAISPGFVSDRTLFAIGSSVVYRTHDAGATWQQSSACCGSGLAVSPNYTSDKTVFAGRSRSVDGGQTFETVLSGYNNGQAFAFSPAYATDHTMFHGDGLGQILISSDDGATWDSLGSTGSNIFALAVSPQFIGDKTMWAGTIHRGVVRSTDGGATWEPLENTVDNNLPGSETVNSLALSPVYASDHLLLTGSLSGLYRTTNAGDTWSTSQAGLLGMRVDQVRIASPGVLFASTSLGLMKSSNGGGSWEALRAYEQPLGHLAGVSPNYASDHTVFAQDLTGSTLFRTVDGGESWITTTQPTLTSDPVVWAISPQYASDHTLWAAAKVSSAGDIFQIARSSDGAQSWVSSVISQYHFPTALALSPAFDQDHSALAAVESAFFTNSVYAGLYGTTNGGESWPYSHLLSDCYSSSQCWPNNGFAVAFSPAYASDHIAFVGTRSSGVWRTLNGIQAQWMRSTFPVTHTVQTRAVSPAFSSDGLVWAGTNGGGVFVSANRGESWTALSNGLIDLRILELAVSPGFASDKTLYAATESGLWMYTYGNVQPTPTNTPQPTATPAPVSTVISPEGGSLTSNDANASTTIIFPANAVTATTVITYAYRSPMNTGGLDGTGHFFDLSASQNSKPITLLNVPVSVIVRYTPAEAGGVIEDTLHLYWWNGKTWSISGILLTSRRPGVVTSDVWHFTSFALLGESEKLYLPVVRR